MALNSCRNLSFWFKELIQILNCYSATKFSSKTIFFKGNSLTISFSIIISFIFFYKEILILDLRLFFWSNLSFFNAANTYASRLYPCELFTICITYFSVSSDITKNLDFCILLFLFRFLIFYWSESSLEDHSIYF